jgi:monoamine oxidase
MTIKNMTTYTFDRRKFIAYLLSTSAVALAGNSRLAHASTLKNTRVVVIGAGCSGLGAARMLVDEGAMVTVIEGKPNIGGRLLTDWSMGAPFEVGAGWIHGPDEDNPTRQLADAVSAQYTITDDDNLIVFDSDGEEMDEDMIEEINENWYNALKRLDNNLENDNTQSLREALSKELGDENFEWAMSAYTEFSLGGSIEKLSALLHDEGKVFDGPDVVVTSGYDELLKPLANGLDIKLSTVVSEINYSDKGAIVKTDNGSFNADYVICSVPLGVLKAGSIKFDPVLPSSYLKSIKKIGFGSVTKIAFKFDKAFWDIDTQYFGVVTKSKGRWNYWMNYRTFSDENILLGLSVGDYALTADEMSDAEITEDALDVLRDVWEGEVGKPIQMLRTRWRTDPFSLGAYSFSTPGVNPRQFDGLAKPIQQRLLLCGEHTNFSYLATTHGAYLSGIRAAEYIIDEA